MTQHTIELGDLLASIPGFWAAWQDLKREKTDGGGASFGSFLTERLPNLLGIGKVDEAIYAPLWMKLTQPERKCIQQLYSAMEKHEVDCLRMIIGTMQRPVEKVIRTAGTSGRAGSSGQSAREEVIYGEDPKLKFLQILAEEVRISGDVGTVVDDLRANRFIIKDPVGHQLYQHWLAMTKWFEGKILKLFVVDKLEDITLDQLSSEIEEFMERFLPARPAGWKPSFMEVMTGKVESSIAPETSRKFLVGSWIAMGIATTLVVIVLAIEAWHSISRNFF
ncbi:MAG: hypothetical protein AAB794_00600 [Patescibacteria group bacterium]